MGYTLHAIVARREILASLVTGRTHAHVVPLDQGLALVPVTDELYDEIGGGGAVDGFGRLSPGLEAWLRAVSVAGFLAYVEADFFGGTGGQAGVGWARGFRVFGPLRAPDAINAALRCLGARANDGRDEFATLGLDLHRHTRDWAPETADEED